MAPYLNQPQKGYKYSIDSYLLANFCNIHSPAKVLDLGTGCGIISFLLSKRYRNIKIFAIEIQIELYKSAIYNQKINNDFKKINFILGDLRKIDKYFNQCEFDYVIANPPYFKKGSGRINKNASKSNARHEIYSDINDFIIAANKVLKNNGIFYTIFIPERMRELFDSLKRCNLEPKLIKCVHSNLQSDAKLILIKAIKNSNPGLKIENPAFLYDKNGSFIQDIKKDIDSLLIF